MKNRRWVLCALLAMSLSVAVGMAQSVGTVSQASPRSYADSPDGLQRQFADLLGTFRANDRSAFRVGLDELGIPDATKWFAANFDPRFSPQLPQEYGQALSKYQSHVTWVMENFAKFPDFDVKVQTSEMPEPVHDVGLESLLPRPLNAVKLENYRLSSGSSDPKHGPPSWVSCFAYVDGRFRFVGGTYPFWAERLTALRGPMSLPAAEIHGMTVQGIAFQKNLAGSGIAAVVQLKVDIKRDGRAGKIKVLSGDPAFVPDAVDYIKSADFGPLPDIPQLSAAKREWEIAVAFFKAKH